MKKKAAIIPMNKFKMLDQGTRIALLPALFLKNSSGYLKKYGKKTVLFQGMDIKANLVECNIPLKNGMVLEFKEKEIENMICLN